MAESSTPALTEERWLSILKRPWKFVLGLFLLGVTMIKCIICGKMIEVDENEFRKDAGTVFVDFGFGSKFDGDYYSGNVHDKCFESIQKNFTQAGVVAGGMFDED